MRRMMTARYGLANETWEILASSFVLLGQQKSPAATRRSSPGPHRSTWVHIFAQPSGGISKRQSLRQPSMARLHE